MKSVTPKIRLKDLELIIVEMDWIITKLQFFVSEQDSKNVSDCLEVIDDMLEKGIEFEGVDPAIFVKIIQIKWDDLEIYVYAIDVLRKINSELGECRLEILDVLEDYDVNSGQNIGLMEFQSVITSKYVSEVILDVIDSFHRDELPLIKQKFDDIPYVEAKLNLAAAICLLGGGNESKYLEFIRKDAKSSCKYTAKFAQENLDYIEGLEI